MISRMILPDFSPCLKCGFEAHNDMTNCGQCGFHKGFTKNPEPIPDIFIMGFNLAREQQIDDMRRGLL